MNKRKIFVVFLVLVCILFSACSDTEKVVIKDTPPLTLAKYRNVYFESIPYDENNPQTTQYGYSKSEKDSNLAYLSIRNADHKRTYSTYFKTIISENFSNSDGELFDYYYFHKESGNWNIKPATDLHLPTESIITEISGGSGNGNFVLRGMVEDGLPTDLLKAEVMGYNFKTIILAFYMRTIYGKFDENFKFTPTDTIMVNLSPIINSSDTNAELQKIFRQAVSGVVIDGLITDPITLKPILTPLNNCEIVIHVNAVSPMPADFAKENGKTIMCNNFYIKNNATKALLAAIGYNFGLSIEKSDTLNFMNPKASYNHMNEKQWKKINDKAFYLPIKEACDMFGGFLCDL